MSSQASVTWRKFSGGYTNGLRSHLRKVAILTMHEKTNYPCECSSLKMEALFPLDIARRSSDRDRSDHRLWSS